jgi:hypothetical protein
MIRARRWKQRGEEKLQIWKEGRGALVALTRKWDSALLREGPSMARQVLENAGRIKSVEREAMQMSTVPEWPGLFARKASNPEAWGAR